MPFAIVSVTNDLTTDQRADRTCQALVKAGYGVLLLGRQRRSSQALKSRSYGMHRLRLLFEKGPLFYAEYNLTLFFYLLFHKYDLVVSNDLDTLPANYFADKIKHLFSPNPTPSDLNPKHSDLSPKPSDLSPKPKTPIRHLHDCHEYFRGVPELVGRKRVTRIWKAIEDHIFPKLKNVTAVNNSVAELYTAEYGNRIVVIRNVPFRKPLSGARNRSTLNIREDEKIILYQGAVNIDRGLEEAILAMKYLKTDAVLVIAGTGDIVNELMKLASENDLNEKVRFTGEIPFQELHSYTLMADIGLSIEKDVSINYHNCLPNKFLDYIQANIPVLVSPFHEMKSIVDQYRIGDFIISHEPEKFAQQVDSILGDPEKLEQYKRNMVQASQELCWEREESRLIEIVTGNKIHDA